MKIIVLSITPYKEKDAIITAISKKETITFLVRNINGPRSKNTALNNILTIADIELMEGNFKHPTLKSSKPLFSSLKMDMNAEYLASLMFIDEMVLNLFPSDEQHTVYPLLEKALESLRKNDDWLKTLLLFMNHVIRLGGFQLEVNQCVLCQSKKNIVAFSFADGGFVCQNCFQSSMNRDLTRTQMLILRKIVNCPDYALNFENCNRTDLMVLFIRFVRYIEDAFGYRFKNLNLLISSK